MVCYDRGDQSSPPPQRIRGRSQLNSPLLQWPRLLRQWNLCHHLWKTTLNCLTYLSIGSSPLLTQQVQPVPLQRFQMMTGTTPVNNQFRLELPEVSDDEDEQSVTSNASNDMASNANTLFNAPDSEEQEDPFLIVGHRWVDGILKYDY